jgi:uroporphyrinogen decarboxylase
MGRNDRFLKALRLERADCTPVWFMRQAGRYMKAYRAIRENYSLIEMFKNPELAAQITLQPIKSFSLDAAIIFADILLPLEGMGIGIEFPPGGGPEIRNPLRTGDAIRSLRVANPEEDLDYVLEALKIVSSELDQKVPLIGFAGAPFTLASYAIEGSASSQYLFTKDLMYRDSVAWNLLMTRFRETIVSFLKAQIRAGAQAVQIFDSWAGCLSPADYRKYVLPHNREIFQELRKEGILSINFGTGTAGFLELLKEAGGDVVSVDWRVTLGDAWRRIGSDVGIQGNLDPVALLAPWPVLQKKAMDILDDANKRPGHIFNLGHGILPSTPEDSVKAIVDFVHESSQSS